MFPPTETANNSSTSDCCTWNMPFRIEAEPHALEEPTNAALGSLVNCCRNNVAQAFYDRAVTELKKQRLFFQQNISLSTPPSLIFDTTWKTYIILLRHLSFFNYQRWLHIIVVFSMWNLTNHQVRLKLKWRNSGNDVSETSTRVLDFRLF